MLRRMDLMELGFGLDTEITARVLQTGTRPFEVPISYFSRSHLEGKKINWKDAVQCVRVLGRVWLSRVSAAVLVPESLIPKSLPHQQESSMPVAARKVI